MGNLIKVMDIEHNVIEEAPFTDTKSFGIQVTTALYNDKTQLVMYQPELSKSLLKYLKDQVRSHNGALGTTIRVEESKLLPAYVAVGGGFGTVDSSDPNYWALRDVDTEKCDIADLDSAYQAVSDKINELVKVSGVGKSQVVFYLRTKNQKK